MLTSIQKGEIVGYCKYNGEIVDIFNMINHYVEICWNCCCCHLRFVTDANICFYEENMMVIIVYGHCTDVLECVKSDESTGRCCDLISKIA